MSVKERIFELKERMRLSQKDIESAAGLTNGAIFGAKAGKSISSDAIARLLEAYPNVSAEWLMRGKGDMLTTGNDSKNQFVFGSDNVNVNGNNHGNITNGSYEHLMKNIQDRLSFLNMQVEMYAKQLEQANATITNLIGIISDMKK